MVVEICREAFTLFSEKAVYWEREEALLITDLHLGKVNHFRRSGIPVPVKAGDHNIEVLVELMMRVKPRRVLLLGDLFHSHYNPAWEDFGEVVKHFKPVSFELVIGNHDIMSDLQYERKGIKVFDDLTIGPFLFTHHPLETIPTGLYNIAGHVHPGVYLHGKGKQSVMLPCFYFGKQQGFLPAFGMFTGMARVMPQRNDHVYVIAGADVIQVSAPAENSTLTN